MKKLIKMKLYRGNIMQLDEVVDTKECISSSFGSFMNDGVVWQALRDLISSNKLGEGSYMRILGPMEDHTYYIDFGSSAYYIQIGLSKNLDSLA